jgi:hypothetical protein
MKHTGKNHWAYREVAVASDRDDKWWWRHIAAAVWACLFTGGDIPYAFHISLHLCWSSSAIETAALSLTPSKNYYTEGMGEFHKMMENARFNFPETLALVVERSIGKMARCRPHPPPLTGKHSRNRLRKGPWPGQDVCIWKMLGRKSSA